MLRFPFRSLVFSKEIKKIFCERFKHTSKKTLLDVRTKSFKFTIQRNNKNDLHMFTHKSNSQVIAMSGESQKITQDTKSASIFDIVTADITSPFPFSLPSWQLPTPKKWLQIFAQSFLWGLMFLVVRRAFLDFESENQIVSAGVAAFLGFAATFVRLTAEYIVWTNYIDKTYDDQLNKINKI